MSYSMKSNSFVSHLTGREYKFADRDSKRAALAKMLEQDSLVRDASQQRGQAAGMKRPLSDREIASGNWINDPTIDRRSTIERVADAALKNGAKHDPFAIAIDTVRAKMRSNDSPEVTAANEATIQRLEQKSAELAQSRAANPPEPEIDPTNPVANAAALRAAARQMEDRGLPEDQARNKRVIESLLKRADNEDAKAVAEQAHADKLADAEGAIADSGASLYLLAKDPEVSQATVNAVRQMHEALKAGEATKQQWWDLVGRIDTERAALKKSKLDANSAERAKLDAERASIRAGTDTTPPADAPPADQAPPVSQ